MIRRIRELLYDQGFTISGARNKIQELIQFERGKKQSGEVLLDGVEVLEIGDSSLHEFDDSQFDIVEDNTASKDRMQILKRELSEIRKLLSVPSEF